LNAASDHADLTINPNHERARKLSFWYNDLINKYGHDAINKIRSLTNKMRGNELPESRFSNQDNGGGTSMGYSGQKKNNLSV
jgi:hypothetical protein